MVENYTIDLVVSVEDTLELRFLLGCFLDYGTKVGRCRVSCLDRAASTGYSYVDISSRNFISECMDSRYTL